MAHISEEILLNAQMKMAIDGYLPSIIVTFSTSWLLYFFLSHYSRYQHYINLWLTMQMLLCLIWLVLYIRYRNDFSPIKAYWANWIEVPLNLFSGLGWGVTWILFVDPQNLNTIVLPNVITSSALFIFVISTPLHRRATNVALISCMFPVILSTLLFENPIFRWLSVGGVILLMSVYFFSLELQELYLRMLLQIEEKKELVDALQREKQQVEEIAQEKSRFLAATSHDLRQPIQAMKLFETVLMPLLTEPRQKEVLTKIGESNQSLINLLEPLLELSKLDSGMLKLNPQWFYVDDIFYQLQQQYADLAAKKHIQLHCVNTSQQLFVDPKQLERILSNLISNAIKYMNRSGKIVLGVRRKKNGLQLDILDNGIGVPDSEQHKIFQAFYQVNNPERHYKKGIGLGLSIVKRTVELMNGHLKFRSTWGKGCHFSIYFAVPEIKSDLSMKETSFDLEETPFHLKANILIVEDDERVVEALVALFENWGLQTQTAYDVETALQTLTHFTPDLILFDYQLRHDQTGLEMLESVQQQLGFSIPALLLTGSSLEEHTRVFETLDCPVLYKPVQPEQLKAIFLKLLA